MDFESIEGLNSDELNYLYQDVLDGKDGAEQLSVTYSWCYSEQWETMRNDGGYRLVNFGGCKTWGINGCISWLKREIAENKADDALYYFKNWFGTPRCVVDPSWQDVCIGCDTSHHLGQQYTVCSWVTSWIEEKGGERFSMYFHGFCESYWEIAKR